MVRDDLLTGVDHVELFVSDVEAAAEWYGHVLGVGRAPAFEEWHRTGAGPLMIAVDDTTKLALFERNSATRGDGVSPHRVAFGTDVDGFLAFLDRLDDLELTDGQGEPVTAADVVDHDLSYSLYFTDPDGNELELTTNEYDAFAAEID